MSRTTTSADRFAHEDLGAHLGLILLDSDLVDLDEAARRAMTDRITRLLFDVRCKHPITVKCGRCGQPLWRLLNPATAVEEADGSVRYESRGNTRRSLAGSDRRWLLDGDGAPGSRMLLACGKKTCSANWRVNLDTLEGRVRRAAAAGRREIFVGEGRASRRFG